MREGTESVKKKQEVVILTIFSENSCADDSGDVSFYLFFKYFFSYIWPRGL